MYRGQRLSRLAGMTAVLLGISHKHALHLIIDHFPFRFWRSLDSFLCAKMREKFNLPTQNNTGTSPDENPENPELSAMYEKMMAKAYRLSHGINPRF
jgi:hypothetical protein